MLGYECDQCGELITQSKPGERRDCPHCDAPAIDTYPPRKETKARDNG